MYRPIYSWKDITPPRIPIFFLFFSPRGHRKKLPRHGTLPAQRHWQETDKSKERTKKKRRWIQGRRMMSGERGGKEGREIGEGGGGAGGYEVDAMAGDHR